MSPKRLAFFSKKNLSRFSAGLVFLIAFSIVSYFGLERFFEWYFVRSAIRLIELEKEGKLSKEYGYVWSEINLAGKMQEVNRNMTGQETDTLPAQDTLSAFNETRKIRISNIPSLSAIRELNKIRHFSNFIQITDRYNFPLAEIKTTHTRVKLNELNEILIKALIYSEDKNFYTRKLAYEYKAFVRALALSFFRSIRNLEISYPRGTSTIHQQVARYLLSKFDSKGYVYAEKSISRKIRELKLAQALKMSFSQDELLQVYLNHCVNAGQGMTGYYDISFGLFGKSPDKLDICQSLYLARLVKWNRNIPQKIIGQVRIDIARLSPYMGWDRQKQDSITSTLENLKLLKPMQIVSAHDPLIDLANEYWLMICRKNGMSELEVEEMDFSRPSSMIRRKGNLKIQLTIDGRLQTSLEKMVKARGFGKDTTIFTDVRIGSFGEDVALSQMPKDTLRIKTVIKKDSLFSEPQSRFYVKLHVGDTLVTNIRYKRKDDKTIRRSVFYYCRDTTHVPGQYYAYAIMNSKTGELLAYCSRDGLGSRLSSLLRNKTPNGSGVAKPILFALNYDVGNFSPFDMITDSLEVDTQHAWSRKFIIENDKKIGVTYLNTSAPGGYPVSNHDKNFTGYDYVFNQLTESNNILGVEMIYRLNRELYDIKGDIIPQGKSIIDLFSRLEDTTITGSDKYPCLVTGTQIYSRIAGVVGASVDSILQNNGKISMPADYYSVALGTLELSLYEQMHLFNVLYGNELVVDPAERPGLVIKSIAISGENVEFGNFVEKRNLFSKMANIMPVQLALHKRLIGNPVDQLEACDILPDSLLPLANFAKSGTTDDIIRPYNKDITSKERTNYGLWNAVLRLELTSIDYDSANQRIPFSGFIQEQKKDSIPEKELLDITLSCVGECNDKNTGARDGKSLHKYVSCGFLHRYGISLQNGFYHSYEKYLIENTPDSIRFCNPYEKPDLDNSILEDIHEKTRYVKFGENGNFHISKRLFFGYGLEKEDYLSLLSLVPYLGNQSGKYRNLLEKLKSCSKLPEMAGVIAQMKTVEIKNSFLKTEYDTAINSLGKSLIQK